MLLFYEIHKLVKNNPPTHPFMNGKICLVEKKEEIENIYNYLMLIKWHKTNLVFSFDNTGLNMPVFMFIYCIIHIHILLI